MTIMTHCMWYFHTRKQCDCIRYNYMSSVDTCLNHLLKRVQIVILVSSIDVTYNQVHGMLQSIQNIWQQMILFGYFKNSKSTFALNHLSWTFPKIIIYQRNQKPITWLGPFSFVKWTMISFIHQISNKSHYLHLEESQIIEKSTWTIGHIVVHDM
jgi:hypothetical protein